MSLNPQQAGIAGSSSAKSEALDLGDLNPATLLQLCQEKLAGIVTIYKRDSAWWQVHPSIVGFPNGQARRQWAIDVEETQQMHTHSEFLKAKLNSTSITHRITICCTPTESYVAKGAAWREQVWHVWGFAFGKEKEAGRRTGNTIYIWDDHAESILKKRTDQAYRNDLLETQRALIKAVGTAKFKIEKVYLGGEGPRQQCLKNTATWVRDLLASSATHPEAKGTELIESSAEWMEVKFTQDEPGQRE